MPESADAVTVNRRPGNCCFTAPVGEILHDALSRGAAHDAWLPRPLCDTLVEDRDDRSSRDADSSVREIAPREECLGRAAVQIRGHCGERRRKRDAGSEYHRANKGRVEFVAHV